MQTAKPLYALYKNAKVEIRQEGSDREGTGIDSEDRGVCVNNSVSVNKLIQRSCQYPQRQRVSQGNTPENTAPEHYVTRRHSVTYTSPPILNHFLPNCNTVLYSHTTSIVIHDRMCFTMLAVTIVGPCRIIPLPLVI